jgi:hypothetical protein
MIDIASFGWPQWLILAWITVTLIGIAKNSGELIHVNAVRSIIIVLLIVVVLVWGGFFHS